MFQVNKVIKFKIEDFTNFISTCSQKELIDLSDALNDSVGKMMLKKKLIEEKGIIFINGKT